MSFNKEKTMKTAKLIVKNALSFLFNIGFVMVFQILFGIQNILPGVAIGVGLTMFPVGYIGIRPSLMAFITVLLYTGSVLVGQLALASMWVALPLNFLFVLLIMVLLSEPSMFKPAISFLLCFVFSQATPVPAGVFPMRILGAFAGGLFVAAATVFTWRKKGQGFDGRGLREQVRLCVSRKGYILRMASGIATAMFVGMALHLKRPLWISIVVMSLTQLHYHETLERIRHRFFGNVVGVAVFIVFFRILVPEKYALAMVLFLGYISFFTSEYKYKQIVNAVSAINASLVLLDTSTAVENRLICLAGGALIVLVLYLLEHGGKKAVKAVMVRRHGKTDETELPDSQDIQTCG